MKYLIFNSKNFRKYLAYSCAAMIFAPAFLSCSGAFAEEIADRVFTNAKVYSIAMDGTETRAEAVAIKDGKFVFIGKDEDAKKLIGKDTVVTDCKGGSLLPGFTDAHMHIAQSSTYYGGVSFESIVPDIDKDTPEDVIKLMQKKLKEYADSHQNDPVIHGNGWDRTWFTGLLKEITRPITRHDIDAVIADKPVVLTSYCGHVVLLNTKALEAAGLTKDSPEPEAGIVRREADGTPDGYIQEPVAFIPIVTKIPNIQFNLEQTKNSIREAFKETSSQGYTLVCDMQQSPIGYEALSQMAKDGEFKARIRGVHNVNDATREEDFKAAVENRKKYDVEDLFVSETAKYFVDGNLSMTIPYTKQYCDENGIAYDFRDPLLWNEDHLKESMKEFRAAGFNIHVHAMGDYAVHATIDAMEEAQKMKSDRKCTDAIAHITFMTEEDKARMAKLGIIASIQPVWQNSNETNGAVFINMYGLEKFKTSWPNKSLINNNVLLAYGSDFPVNHTSALSGIEMSQTRRYSHFNVDYEKYKDLPAMNPAECCTLKDALKAHTINGAYQLQVEDITGSIELGKSAELVRLDVDIESTPVTDLSTLKVRETILKGKTVYMAE